MSQPNKTKQKQKTFSSNRNKNVLNRFAQQQKSGSIVKILPLIINVDNKTQTN